MLFELTLVSQLIHVHTRFFVQTRGNCEALGIDVERHVFLSLAHGERERRDGEARDQARVSSRHGVRRGYRYNL